VSHDATLIDQLAETIADGGPVDWAAIYAGADPADHPVLDRLRVLSAVATVHWRNNASGQGAPAATDAAAQPQSWGHLRLLERIGQGSFADVYRAWDSRLDREVALKLLHAAPAEEQDDAPAATIIHEGRLLARIRHPGVVTIHGADRVDGRIGLWMELLHGRTLEALVQEGLRFTPEAAARLGVELGRAVAAVHAAGLLHRDIKAQNVMQTDDGRVVLMDFGTGRELTEAATDLTGTPLYLAPEIFDGGPASVKSDIYSLGVVLDHVLSGSFPVDAPTTPAVHMAHQRGERVRLDVRRTDIPVGLRRVVARATDPNPVARYASAGELVSDLEALTARPERPRRRRFIAAAAVLATAVVASTWSVVWRTSDLIVPPGALAPAAGRTAIAVLPFRNFTADPDLGVMADGLTAEIVGRLAAIDGLDVRSSSSVFALPSFSSGDLDAVGRMLDVTLALTGSVLSSNERIRINVELVRVADGAVLWSDVFTEDDRRFVAAHDAIALAIVNRLRLRVASGQRRYEIDPDLHYLFLRARGLLARRHTENAGRAAELFEQVVARDPSFAPAWAGLASALGAFSLAVPAEALPPPDPRMDEAALEALRLDPFLAEAQAAVGSLHARDREWESAEVAFREALRLNASLTWIHTDFVLSTLLPLGRLDEGVALLEEARAIDPLSLDVRRVLALLQVDAGRYEAAIGNARWVLDRDPAFPYADLWLARALMLSGRADEARPILERDPNWFGYLGYLEATSGNRERAEALAAAHPESPGRQMLIYGGLGDADRAFTALDRTADVYWWRAATWMHRPELAVLRNHPRLEALKRRLRLLD
jgi:serine/threonine-protein kinase